MTAIGRLKEEPAERPSLAAFVGGKTDDPLRVYLATRTPAEELLDNQGLFKPSGPYAPDTVLGRARFVVDELVKDFRTSRHLFVFDRLTRDDFQTFCELEGFSYDARTRTEFHQGQAVAPNSILQWLDQVTERYKDPDGDPYVSDRALGAMVEEIKRRLPYQAPVGDGFARPFLAYTVNELAAFRTQEPGIDWLVDGYLARGHVTLLSASPKVGKTTLAFELAEAIVKGKAEVIGRRVKPGRVFHVDLEMGETLTLDWARRYGLDQHEEFRLWSGTRAQITDDVAGLREKTQLAEADVLVVDSFSKWTVGLVESEADNPGLIRELQALKRLAVELNVAVLVIHHFRKAPGSFAELIRGGSSIFAEVDIAVNMHRKSKEDLSNSVRRLDATGRFQEVTPDELYVTRLDGRYVAAPGEADRTASQGAKPQRALGDQEKKVLAVVMAAALTGLTREEITVALGEAYGATTGVPTSSTVTKALNRLRDGGQVKFDGQRYLPGPAV